MERRRKGVDPIPLYPDFLKPVLLCTFLSFTLPLTAKKVSPLRAKAKRGSVSHYLLCLAPKLMGPFLRKEGQPVS